MKNFKYVLRLITMICFSIMLINCDNDNLPNENQVYTYSSGKIDIIELINSEGLQNKSSSNLESFEELTIEAIFTSNIEIPENLSDEELSEFFESNKDRIEGELKYKMNDLDIYTSLFNNGLGNKQSGKKYSSNKKEGDCSYEGVRQCTVDKIDALTDLQKVICAFRRGCVITKVVACTVENCSGDDENKDTNNQDN